MKEKLIKEFSIPLRIYLLSENLNLRIIPVWFLS